MVITRGIFDFDIAYIAIYSVYSVYSVYTLRVAAFFRSVVSSVRLFLLRLRLGSIKNIFTDDRGDAAGVPQRVSAFRRFGGAEADALGKRRAAQLANPVTKPTSCRKRRRRRSFGNSANFFTHCRYNLAARPLHALETRPLAPKMRPPTGPSQSSVA